MSLLVSFPPERSPVVGVVELLAIAGVVFRSLLPTPLRTLVVHHLPRCVSVCMWSVGSLFLHGALDSHPVFPPRAASGRCVLTAAAARVPAGVVSAFVVPSSWRTGGYAGCCGGHWTVFAAHSPPHSGRPPHASPRFRVRAAPVLHPPCVLSWSSMTCLPTLPCAWGQSTPSLRVAHVGIAPTCMVSPTPPAQAP